MIEVLDEFRMVQGEDWACYVEWIDQDGNPIASTDEALAMMQVRNDANALLLEFVSAADSSSSPAAHILGESGVVRLTCPRSFSAAMAPGRYHTDLFIKHVDPEQVVFEGTAQHHRLLKAWFIVEKRITVASMPGGGSGGSTPISFFKKTIGDGISTSFSLVHNLGTKDVEVLVYSALDGSGADVEHQRISLNEVVVTFTFAPPVNSFRVIITER